MKNRKSPSFLAKKLAPFQHKPRGFAFVGSNGQVDSIGLPTRENQYRDIFRGIKESVFVIDPQENMILDANPSACDMLGYTREELLSGGVAAILPEPQLEAFAGRVAGWGRAWTDGICCTTKSGDVLPVAISGSMVPLPGKVCIVASVRLLENDRRSTIAAGLPSPMLPVRILDSARDPIISVDEDQRIIVFNQGAEEVFGYARCEVLGKPLDLLIPPRFHGPRRRLIGRSVPSGAEAWGMGADETLYGVRRDGGRFPVEASISTVEVDETNVSTVILRDITKQIEAERALKESEQRFRQVVEQAADPFVLSDETGRYVEVNDEMCSALGYTREELLNMSVTDVAIDVTAESLKENWQTLLSGVSTVEQVKLRRKDGEDFPAEIHARMIELAGNKFRLSLARDLTERERAEERVKASLREKEVLLKEINHRVKNSLQVVSSLLSLQAQNSQDGTLRELLQESQDRIKAMALIHEKLYESDDLAGIDFSGYLRNLAANILKSYAINPESLALTIDASHIFLPVNMAIPCGLIVNELMSNSIKHAFAPSQGGAITIQMRDQGGSYSLLVGDSGDGFPEGFAFRESKTMGLRLVTALVDQLRGTIELASQGGSRINISFPKS